MAWHVLRMASWWCHPQHARDSSEMQRGGTTELPHYERPKSLSASAGPEPLRRIIAI
eukprot:CAMPEP_0181185772 /NCGR_PEP_ID=MMETSP1096-20121128/9686_1 /TAXON_ID=156174 ORGANISM="Chrysochromulina ericina, Strain CCMP281" /NCGR_SAMPLE_ID=MMETSP1096 /ASSEMBLY_ACC=CAM_ASM_000453 /LENGTH=56 /DNA_ID=CAMNT_0023274639 /DNA_START=315 /DNA_END=485 /DNA_ORIENTATION=+